jgi:O-antigen ligase
LGERAASDADLQAADRGLVLLVAWAGVALFTSVTVRHNDDLSLLAKAIVGCTAVAGAVAYLQLAGLDVAHLPLPPGLVRVPGGDDPILIRAGLSRTSGTTAHPIELGVLLAAVLPVALMQRGFRQRWYWKAAAVVIIAPLPLALSRSAVITLLVALAVLAVYSGWRERLLGLSFTVGTIGLTAVLLPRYFEGLVALFSDWGSDPSVSGRTDDYSDVLPFLVEHPWLGRGFRTFAPSQYFLIDNQYLMTLLDMGIAGLTAFLGLIVTGLVLLRRAITRSTETDDRRLFRGLLAAGCASAVGMASFDGLSFPTFAALFFLLSGMVASRAISGPINTRSM